MTGNSVPFHHRQQEEFTVTTISNNSGLGFQSYKTLSDISYQKNTGTAPAAGSAWGSAQTNNNPQELLAWLEGQALPYYQAIMNGQVQASQQEVAELEQWISWAQDQLGAASSNWNPVAGGAYVGTGTTTSALLPKEPNSMIAGPNGNYVANWENVEINYYSGDPSNAYATDIFTNEVTINSSAYVDISATPVKHPLTGEDVLEIKITDLAQGTEKIIYIHNNAKVKINSVSPEDVKIDTNAATLWEITTGQFEKPTEISASIANADDVDADGNLLFKQANATLGPIDGKTAYVYATGNVDFTLDPMDKITSVENSTMPSGEDAIKVVITRADGTTDTYYIRKTNGLTINFLNVVDSQFATEPDLNALTSIEGIPDQISINWADKGENEFNQKLKELAAALGLSIEEVFADEELKQLLSSLDMNQLSLEEDSQQLWEINKLMELGGLSLKEILGSTTMMDFLYTHKDQGSTKINCGDEEKSILFGMINNLINEMGIKGNLDAIETLLDEEIIDWIKNPTLLAPETLLEFFVEYDQQMPGDLSNDEDVATRLAELLNTMQGKYNYTTDEDHPGLLSTYNNLTEQWEDSIYLKGKNDEIILSTDSSDD